MALEIRILGGARAGQRQVFEKSIIAVGRHPLSDLRFDPERDLDVSTRHAEIRAVGGRWVIRDNASTNGTFVNGERALPERELHDGDRIAFGPEGPQVEVRLVSDPAAAATPAPTRMGAASPPRAAEPVRETPRRSTTERIAIAVREQTSHLTRLLVAAVIVLGAGVGMAFWLGHRAAAQQVEQMRQMLAQNESALAALNGRLATIQDTTYARVLERRGDSLRARIERAPAGARTTLDSLQAALRAQHDLVTLDAPAINARNAPAVAMLYSEIDGRTYGGTAFAVTKDGLLVTNRHNVQNPDGTRASRLAVTFRDTKEVWPAHVVKVSDDAAVDLALVQVDRGAPFPVVAGIAPEAAAAPEGAAVVTIGYPLSTDLPMEGSGRDMIVKTTLDPGTVSKRVTTILQIDAYAAHGSSGSPVFNAAGNVVGVVYGGPAEGNGRIVYAVPGDKLAAFLPPELHALTR
ncbi:MAG: trypsin-like peptidase domain-containing protein [Gemmatimonadota bacterium]|nr:trypsin-like peptidase domain-containing protein [Gemmatimonadota bacterium]MDE3173192.1 trypsin-like peptidase domain-containing protein [Gemmatimonadota bacterium]